jgi:sterol desaturase/sphingolipid hydroxylase (fatty acid hydroxylase superfamily)
MRLSQASYYADYYVYPIAAATLSGVALYNTPMDHWASWAIAFVGGVVVWTFVEYQLHRWVFHHAPVIKDMHEAHHEDQVALIGTPTWMSLLLFALIVLLPAVLITDLAIGSGLTAGLMLGYLWYVTVHHGVHHWTARPGTYFFNLKRRHALHHHFDDMGNFGVITGFWDKVFGTDIKVRKDGKGRRQRTGEHA